MDRQRWDDIVAGRESAQIEADRLAAAAVIQLLFFAEIIILDFKTAQIGARRRGRQLKRRIIGYGNRILDQIADISRLLVNRGGDVDEIGRPAGISDQDRGDDDKGDTLDRSHDFLR